MTRYVLGFAMEPTLSNVVLVRKSRPEWQAGKLNGVGCKVRGGEDLWFAMEREYGEETNTTGVLAWRMFGRLWCSEWEVMLFQATAPELRAYHEFPEGVVSVHSVADVAKGSSKGSEPLPCVRWLLTMAVVYASSGGASGFHDVRVSLGSSGLYDTCFTVGHDERLE